MCAITGILNFDSGRPVDAQTLIRMRDSMFHRGPDEEGIFLGGPVGLAARRLSIIDLATGNQPVHNEDRSVWAVQNGEIYNFQSLRSLLQKKGHQFYTKGDTEILVHAYEEYGPECVQVLKGMFAFAIWDENRRVLFLARDRMGEKPLYYYAGPREFVFGSELKSLLRHPDTPRQLDQASLSKYLTFQFVPAPHTIFRQLRKLQPGHSILVTLDRTREIVQRQYWDIPLSGRKGKPDVQAGIAVSVAKRDAALVDELTHLLRSSVTSQLVSDVPLGVLLSGGIDSALVATLAAQSLPQLQTFTMSFDEPSYDESQNAALVAKRIGSKHHVEVCRSAAVRDLIPRIASFMDEPLADASILPTYLLTKFTVKSVKVALGGEGGDELFAGYPTFLALRLRSAFRRLPLPARAAVSAGVRALPVSHEYISFDFKLRQFLRGVNNTPEQDFFHWMGAFTDTEKPSLLSRDLRGDTYEDLHQLMNARKLENENQIQRCLYLCAKLYLQDGVLVKVDRASMANSLEVRAPYLDHELVEFAARLPLEKKLGFWKTKVLLREAAKSLLPSEIMAQRKKRGFGAPISKWILGDLKELFRHYLDGEQLKRGGIFNPTYVERLLLDHLARRQNNSRLLWTLLVFQLWQERWHTNGVEAGLP